MRRTYRRSQRKTHKRKKTKSKSKSRSGYKPSVHNSMPKCVQLFKKYKLTNQSKLVKWVNHNHPDHANARGSKQSSKLKDDYKFITGCFGNRKRIFQAMKSSKTKSKSKSKSKKKVKEIKGGGPSTLWGNKLDAETDSIELPLQLRDIGSIEDPAALQRLYSRFRPNWLNLKKNPAELKKFYNRLTDEQRDIWLKAELVDMKSSRVGKTVGAAAGGVAGVAALALGASAAPATVAALGAAAAGRKVGRFTVRKLADLYSNEELSADDFFAATAKETGADPKAQP